jgi:hypothetical protein
MLGLSRRLLITRYVGNESDASIRFKTIRPILLKVLHSFFIRNIGAHGDSRSILSTPSTWESTWDLTSIVTHESSKVPSISEAAGVLKMVSASLGPRASLLAESIRHIVIQGPGNDGEIGCRSVSASVLREMAIFIMHVFRKCTEDMKLSVIALDNIHHADPASWLVLRNIFETAHNVLMVGTSFGSADSTFRVETKFWRDLNDVHANSAHFITMEIGALNSADLELMTMKALGISCEDVNQETLNEVVVQSGGMPHFAAKILQAIRGRTSSVTVGAFGEHDESISEIILHRVDMFDLNLRNTLNIGAVVGEHFTFDDVHAVLVETTDSSEADLRQQTSDSLSLAVEEGILSVGEKNKSSTRLEARSIADGTVLSFRHSMWWRTLLGLMLDSRKRGIHRKIATAMDLAMKKATVSVNFKSSLFRHWKLASDTSRATDVALVLGRDLQSDEEGRFTSIKLYKDGLSMWGWYTSAVDNVGGLSEQVLKHVTSNDHGNILRLMVALGKACSTCDQTGVSVKLFEDALRIKNVVEHTSKIHDGSILFPTYIGLATALANGVVHQDAQCQYEQKTIREFIEETRKHGRLIHHVYALYLQMQFYSRQDELDKAVAVQSIIKKIYKPERHCEGLRSVYGIDAGAVSYALAAM